MRQKPIHAPITSPSKILDIGCGVNADMTIYLAKKFPAAQVFAVDLSVVDVEAPQNVQFIKGNVRNLIGEHPDLKEESFDYVFSRFLVTGIEDWPGHMKDVARFVAPGGHFEMHDLRSLEYYNASEDLISKDWKWPMLFTKQPDLDEPGSGAGYFRKVLGGLGFIELGEEAYRMDSSPSLRDDPVHGAWARYAASELMYPRAFKPVRRSKGGRPAHRPRQSC